jgi:hypothetical protein
MSTIPTQEMYERYFVSAIFVMCDLAKSDREITVQTRVFVLDYIRRVAPRVAIGGNSRDFQTLDDAPALVKLAHLSGISMIEYACQYYIPTASAHDPSDHRGERHRPSPGPFFFVLIDLRRM